MKVLLLAYDLGLQGGVGTFNYELSHALTKLGIEVILAVRSDAIHLAPDSATVVALKVFNIPPKDVLCYLYNKRTIIDAIRKLKPDVIHDSSSTIGLMPEVTKYAPTISTVHGSPLIKYMRFKYGSLNDKFRHVLFELTHKLPSRVLGIFCRPIIKKFVFVSMSCLADTITNLPQSYRREILAKSCVIYNGISVDNLRRSFGNCMTSSKDIIFIGRLMQYKGPDRLIKAFALIRKELREVRLHIIGSGPMLPHLKKLVTKLNLEKYVIFYGWLKRSIALKVLANSAVLVHPSLYESFCYSIVEAYTLGKPVIAHKAPYAKELVGGMGTGLVVDTFNVRELAESVLVLLTDKGMYRKFSQRASYVAEHYFDINKIAKQYIEVYEKVLREPI